MRNFTDADDTVWSTSQVREGLTAFPAVAPIRVGYIFLGWSTPRNDATNFDFATPITANRTLYARWTPDINQRQVVTFDPNGGAFAGVAATPLQYRDIVHADTYSQAFDTNGNLVNPALVAPTRTSSNSSYEWRFEGWFNAPVGGSRVNSTDAVTTDLARTLYAQWHRSPDVTDPLVRFLWNDGIRTGEAEVFISVRVHNGHTVSEPVAPQRANYRFEGWSTDRTALAPFDFATPITADRDLYAIWYYTGGGDPVDYVRVNFFMNRYAADDALFSTIEIERGTAVAAPPMPTRAGYIFQGWSTPRGNAANFDFATLITADETDLFARWIVNDNDRQIVIFNPTQGAFVAGTPTPVMRNILRTAGQTYAQAFDAYGNLVANPLASPAVDALVAPTRPGYTFVGWFTAPAGGVRVLPTDAVANEPTRTLFAQWMRSSDPDEDHTVRFLWNNGSIGIAAVFHSVTVYDGSVVSPPSDPERALWIFAGWHTNPNLSTPFDFNTPITDDLDLFAHWNLGPGVDPDYVRVNFWMNRSATDNALFSTTLVEVDTNVLPLAPPTRPLYEFVHWTTDRAGNNVFDFNTLVDDYKDLYAQWLLVYVVVDVDRDGSVTVNTPPGVEYQVLTPPGEVNEEGNIVVVIRPETGSDVELEREDIVVNLPGNDWTYELDPCEDNEGEWILVITPPTIGVNDNDEVTLPPGTGDREWTQAPGSDPENPTIIVTPPTGWNPDDDLVAIDIPGDWDYNIVPDPDRNGEYIIILTPPSGLMLEISNFPATVVRAATPAQTASGSRVFGTPLNLVSGVAQGWEFLGWAEATPANLAVIAVGNDINDVTLWTGATMPARNLHLIAIWGRYPIIGESEIIVDVDRGGYVTVTRPPGVDYEPITPPGEVNDDGNIVIVIRPETPGDTIEDDIFVNLPGDDWTYIVVGPVNGEYTVIITPPTVDISEGGIVNLPPGTGDHEWSYDRDSDHNIIITPPDGWNPDDDLYVLNLPPYYESKVIECPDRDGEYIIVVTPRYMLTVRNHPTAVSPTGQTANGVRTVGVQLDLASGTATGRQFLGWATTITAAANGRTWAQARDLGHLVPFNNPDGDATGATMPHNSLTVYAVWGWNGVIGGQQPPAGFNLTVSNFPTTIARPATQTQSGTRAPGAALNLVSGSVAGRQFLGWTTTTANLTTGMTWAAAVAAGHITAPPANMPSNNLTVHAVWGWNGVIGGQQPPGGGGGGGGGGSTGGGGGGTTTPPTTPPVTPPTTPPALQEEPQDDIVDDTINELFRARFMQGYPDGTFRPGGSLTRAEATAILVRTMTSQSGIGAPRAGANIAGRFSDVNGGEWFFNYVAVAYRYGLIRGYEDGTFRPNQPISRQELAAIIARTTTVRTAGTLPYTDAANVAPWARNYVYTLNVINWMHGDAVGTFRPTHAISRAETAALIGRALGRADTNASSVAGVANVRIFPDATNTGSWYYFYLLCATNNYYFYMQNNVARWTRTANR